MSDDKDKRRPASNPDLHRAMVGKRSSGAAGAHGDKRSKRARTRGASIRRDLRDQGRDESE